MFSLNAFESLQRNPSVALFSHSNFVRFKIGGLMFLISDLKFLLEAVKLLAGVNIVDQLDCRLIS